MNMRTLGQNLEVSALGLGCCSAGGGGKLSGTSGLPR